MNQFLASTKAELLKEVEALFARHGRVLASEDFEAIGFVDIGRLIKLGLVKSEEGNLVPGHCVTAALNEARRRCAVQHRLHSPVKITKEAKPPLVPSDVWINPKEAFRLGCSIFNQIGGCEIRTQQEVARLLGMERGSVLYTERMALGKLCILVREPRRKIGRVSIV